VQSGAELLCKGGKVDTAEGREGTGGQVDKGARGQVEIEKKIQWKGAKVAQGRGMTASCPFVERHTHLIRYSILSRFNGRDAVAPLPKN
jgi:hypothetical protein